MDARPVLILQMQRMGDLVLTFPLLLWLQTRYPDAPLWVVAEEHFYSGLMPLAPNVTFFPPAMASRLTCQPYQLVINLSHRPEAARLAASVTSDEVVGPIMAADDTVHIRGDWQLYRASLPHNNRHNLFHWAELNALDIISQQEIANSRWKPPETDKDDQTRIGLFVGASEAEKRPEPVFWADLAAALLQRGYKPVFLGGPADSELGTQAAQLLNAAPLNLCGRFSLEELVRFFAELRLLVTPDTGPMHVAAWGRTPVLNLSMGPVHPWETGPYQPGQHILRSTISCTGCWQCKHPSVLCKNTFTASRIAALVHTCIKTGAHQAEKLRMPGLCLWRSAKGSSGCYMLYANGHTPGARERLAAFWQAYFLQVLPTGSDTSLPLQTSAETVALSPAAEASALQLAWQAYVEQAPQMALLFKRNLVTLSRELALAIRRDGGPTKDANFWAAHPPFIRPLSGFMHMLLQNSAYSRSTYLRCIGMIEELLAALAR